MSPICGCGLAVRRREELEPGRVRVDEPPAACGGRDRASATVDHLELPDRRSHRDERSEACRERCAEDRWRREPGRCPPPTPARARQSRRRTGRGPEWRAPSADPDPASRDGGSRTARRGTARGRAWSAPRAARGSRRPTPAAAFFAMLTTTNEPKATNGIAAKKNAVSTRVSR